MPKLLSSIIKQKKIILFVVLILVIAVSIPTLARAEYSFEDGFTLLYIDLIYFIGNIFKQYANLSSSLLSKVISELLSAPITTSELTKSAWVIVRDISNMLIVLGFVVVGLATTLRIRDYEAKKILVPLIIIALLVNFSLLLVGLIIDASNMATDSLLGGKSISGSFGRGIYLDISQPYMQTFTDAYSSLYSDDIKNFTVKVVLYCIMFFIIGTTFLYYVFIFFERYIMLLILSIIAPIAFFAWIFPVTKKYWNSWMEQVIKWAFVGIAGAFFINIATKLLDIYKKNKIEVIPTDTNLLNNPDLYPLLMVTLLLFIGLKVVKKNSGIVGTAVMGLAGAAVGMAAGYATGGASLLAKAGGKGLMAGTDAATKGRLSGAGQRISSGVGRAMENIGLRKQGTSAQTFQKGMKETTDRISSMDEGDKTRVATGRAITAQGKRDKVAAIQDKVKNGRIGELGNATQQAQAITYAESYTKNRGGVSTLRKDALKLNPNIAANPTELREAVQKQTPREFAKNIDKTALTPAVLGAMDDKQMTTLANSGAKEKRNAVRDLVHTSAGKITVQNHVKELLKQKKYSDVKEVTKNFKDAQKLFK